MSIVTIDVDRNNIIHHYQYHQ